MSAQEWVLLGSAVIPVTLAIGVYYFGFKLARKHDEHEEEKS